MKLVLRTILACALLVFSTAAKTVASTPLTPITLSDPDNHYCNVALGILQRVLDDTGRSLTYLSINKNIDLFLVNSSGPKDNPIAPDGYTIEQQGKTITITGKDKGLVYGVCGFIKDFLCLEYWGDRSYTQYAAEDFLPVHPLLKKGPYRSEPTFTYRQTQNYLLATDSLYKWWYRLEEPKEEFVDNLWVHTCDRLLPASRYGEAHPEYYAFYGGKHHPGSASQWCMSNPEVLEIVCQRLDSLFKANPAQNTISISQNDGSDTYCRCPLCQAAIDEEGGPSGPILRFINKVADRFPDKTISTLAYLFSMQPPKVTKPRPNVSIMLCDIDCRRQTALTENPSGQYFMKALEGWSAICDNLFVWDYGINFDNYLSPFPNFSTMGYNMRIFQEHNVKMHFSQIASMRGGDMAELRSYLAANLMWDAKADCDSLVRHFLEGYYGDAAGPLYRYIRTMEGAAVGTDVDLFIYDSPVSYKENILRPALMKRYNEYFDEAERRVANDKVYLARVQRSRLPLQYSALEIARTNPDMDREEAARALALFEQRCKRFNVPTLNERSNPPQEYVELYRARYLTPQTENKARGAQITYLIEPRPKYQELARTALTDGVYGGTTYVENWVGWEGTDGAFVIDLASSRKITSVSCDFLHQIGAWILLPKAVSYSTSNDGTSWTPLDTIDIPEKRSGKVEFVPIEGRAKNGPVKARYIKVEVTGTKVCPPWHYGVGNYSWFFIDEVLVN